MINKKIDKMDDKNYYNEWVDIIDKGYTQSSYSIDETYFLKDELSSELAHVYVNSLMNYYSKLKHLHASYVNKDNDLTEEQKKNNLIVIRKEVSSLLIKYREFVYTVLSIKDIEIYKDIGVPNEFLILNDYI